MEKIIFTVADYGNGNDAGPKAKRDIDYFLAQDGFKIIHQQLNNKSKLDKVKTAYWTIPHLFNNVGKFDELFFQYPTYSSYVMKKLVKKMRAKAKKLFFIIHDVESLRLFQNDQEYWKGERALFNTTDGLIVHNTKMKQWLRENGVNVPMLELEIFDYKNPQPINQNNNYDKSICFAGNLSKSKFLEKIELEDGKLEIFGSHPSKNYKNGVYYKGQMTPDELPQKLVQSFGLVWDGASLSGCEGKFGNYMRYNNPHKVSLYLSSGQPVIIWNQAALAEFIVNNKLGIAVSSLENLDSILNNVSIEEYHEYKMNVLKMANKLRKGFFIKSAISKIEK